MGETAALRGVREPSAGTESVLPVTGALARDAAAADRPRCCSRVLFVIPGEARGSSMIFARRQAEELQKRGIEVSVFHLRSRTSPPALGSEFLRFRRQLRTTWPHIVHAHFGTMTALFAALAAPLLPLVITFRGSDLNPVPGPLRARCRAALGRFLSQLAALRAARIVCVSQQLREHLWWRARRAVVLPSGVDPDTFAPQSKASARSGLGWPAGQRVVLFNAGHDLRIKRLDLAEAAVRVARRAIPDLRLLVLDGNCPPEQVPALMNAADCLLLTSDSEGSPTVVQEALACNLPVVSVDVGDTVERLQGVAQARIVARDPEALGDAIAALLAEPSRSDGRRRIHEFSLHRIAAELEQIYAELAARKLAGRGQA